MGASETSSEAAAAAVQQANRELVKLREHADSFADEMYLVPTNPTPKHITRMLDDLSVLAEQADKDDHPSEVWTQFEQTIETLDDLRGLLYQTSAPPDPFEEHC